MIGRTISHYEVLEKLGEGGMGVVYKARDSRLKRFVSLKVLPPEKVTDAERKQRFVQEARSASALNHPNIVTVYDIDQSDGIDFIAMEFIEGKTLDELMGRKGLKLNQALKYAVQIADALAKAHAAGIVHRDLKPGNVMVTADGRVKVLDFGLAKLTEAAPISPEDQTLTGQHSTGLGMIMGTSGYMSPEQAEGKTVDARSDIFSFGAVLYEMLTGVRPFERDTTISTLASVLRDDPAPLHQVTEGVPPEVERVVNRCLRKDAGRRFQHTADLKIALEELKQESDAGSLGAVLPAAASRGRDKWLHAGLAATLLVATGAALLDWRGRKVDEEPLTAVPLTSYPGAQSRGTFSPDGNQIVFAWRREGERPMHIYVKLIGPGPPLQLTHADSFDDSPAWSPDGATIAFIRSVGNRVALMLMPALGGVERQVAEWPAQPAGIVNWSPDGQWLLYARRDPITAPSGVFATNPTTGVTRRLTTPTTAANFGDTAPALAPDGRTLAFARNVSGTGTVELLEVSPNLEPRGQSRTILRQELDIRSLAWTPDGKEVVCSVGVSNPVLWRAPVSGGKPRPLTGVGAGESPSFSRPRGPRQLSRLAVMQTSADENVWKLPISRGKAGEPVLVIDSTRRDFEPRISPDGSRLLFASDRSGTVEVWMADADGSAVTQITTLGAQTTSGARWSPDGRRIAFLSTAPGQQEIYVMDAGGGGPVRVTDNPAHDTAPSWSRDGQWIYFASNRTGRFEVWKARPEAQAAAVQVTRNGGYSAIESLDGATVYYAQRGGSQGIWKVPAAGGEETLIIPAVSAWGDFDVTRDGIVFVDPSGRAICLYRYDTGQITPITTLPRKAGFGLSVAPDGTIFYTLIDRESSELVLVENFH